MKIFAYLDCEENAKKCTVHKWANPFMYVSHVHLKIGDISECHTSFETFGR